MTASWSNLAASSGLGERAGSAKDRSPSIPIFSLCRASARFGSGGPVGGERANGRYPRNLVTGGRSGEGPFTIRFADLRYRALPINGLLSSRPNARPIARATSCATRPRSPPRRHHAVTCERCCGPSSAAKSCRVAESASGTRCTANRECGHRCPHVGLARSPTRRRLQDCQPRRTRIPQITRITPLSLLRPHRCSRSRLVLQPAKHAIRRDAANFWVKLLAPTECKVSDASGRAR